MLYIILLVIIPILSQHTAQEHRYILSLYLMAISQSQS